MDAAFEILVPIGSRLQPFEFKVPLYEWQGVSYPQGQLASKFGKNFDLKILDNYDYGFIKNNLPNDLQNLEWQVISITGEGLDLYNASLFGLEREEESYRLKDLLNTVLNVHEN